jgi:hypothetical protein
LNKEKVVETLRRLPADRWTRKKFVTTEGRYCALGWLFHEIGLSDHDLEILQGPVYDTASFIWNQATVKFIEAYGDCKGRGNIIWANDTSASRDEMIQKVEQLYWEITN